METIGFVGVGKVGLPICRHLIKAGHRVLGYRRSIRALAEFEKAGRYRGEIASRCDGRTQTSSSRVCLQTKRLRRS